MPLRGLSRLFAAAAVVAAMNPTAGPVTAGHYVQQQQQPTFRTEANYVRVDVYPTAGGAPVLDLRQVDFEVLEDGVPQKIDTFEHVLIRGVAQDLRGREPSTVTESRAMLENPRARVFVLFLDAYHVSVDGSASIRDPLTRTLDRLIGPEDLFAVMTPEMSALDLAFSRKTTTIAGILNRHWVWGERFQIVRRDPEDNRYQQCYPGFTPAPGCLSDAGIAEEMIDRRHEKRTIDALRDLVRHLRGVREERKAILVLSEGWKLFTPDTALARMVNCETPGRQTVGIDPRTGRLTGKPANVDPQTGDRASCDRDRQNLAQIDNDREFREILDEANRANASFYPVDPRGLPVFDEPIVVPNADVAARGLVRSGAPPSVDNARLRARLDSLRTLADATDGLAVLNSNDLDGGLKRVTDDLSSYYLLAYYSSGRLDGRFHKISVRVKRPGVQVRARRGYLAPTAAEVAASASRAAPADAAAAAEMRVIESLMSPLTALGRELPLRLNGVAGWKADNAAAITVVGEIGPGDEWKAGADADLMLTSASGDTLVTERAVVPAGTRGFRVTLAPGQPIVAGEYTVRVRARGRSPSATPANDVLRLTLPASPAANGAIFIRRGPATGNRDAPTADLRFRRTEQLRVERPAAGDGVVTARLLDRTGKPMPVPVVAAVRDDPDGSRWQTAQVTLAPLAAGDYVIEMTGGAGGGGTAGGESTRTLLAFRVVQ